MKGFTNLSIAGNVTRPLELRYTAQGTAVLDVNLAINSKNGEQETTTWASFAAWGKTAEVLNQYVNKGDPLLLSVRDISIETYERRDGSVGTSLKGTVTGFTFLGTGKRDDAQSGGWGAAPQGGSAPQLPPQPPQYDENDVPW